MESALIRFPSSFSGFFEFSGDDDIGGQSGIAEPRRIEREIGPLPIDHLDGFDFENVEFEYVGDSPFQPRKLGAGGFVLVIE